MKILLIVTELESANGICALAVMKELISRGNTLFCITNQEFGTPSSYNKDNIEIFTVKPRFTYIINSRLNRNRSRLKSIVKSVIWLLNKLKLIISIPTWPLISPLYSLRIYKLAKQLNYKYNFDCVIPVYSQIDTIIAAYKIKKTNPSIKYVPYFLDNLSGGYGPKIFSNKWTIKRGLKWERKLLSNSDLIIMMESARKHHETYSVNEKFYKKIKYLDLPLLNDNIKKANEHHTIEFSTLVYVGSLPFGIRSPEFLLKVFKQIHDEKWRFIFVGDDSCDVLNKYAISDSRITVIGRCPHEKALIYEAKADVLVNIGNKNPNMTPSKVFEYMSWGKKILSTAPIENEPSIPYLKNYPLALILPESNLDNSIQRLISFVESNVKEIDFKDLKMLFYKNTPEAFVEIINMSIQK